MLATNPSYEYEQHIDRFVYIRDNLTSGRRIKLMVNKTISIYAVQYILDLSRISEFASENVC